MGWKEKVEGESSTSKSKVASVSSLSDLFKPATEMPPVKSMVVACMGLPKTGKSSFILSARETGKPVYIIDTEKSSNILIQMLPASERANIHVLDVMESTDKRDGSGKLNLTMSLELVEKAINMLYDLAEKSDEPGFLCLDSSTDLWEFMKSWLMEDVPDKVTTKTGKMMQVEWSKPNARYTEVMRLLIKSGWNVILTFRAEEVYGSSGERTGIYKPKGQKDTLFYSDLIIETKRLGNTYSIGFNGGRFGDLSGETIENPTWLKLQKFISGRTGIEFAN